MNSEQDLADALAALDRELERRLRGDAVQDEATRAETIGLLAGLIAGLGPTEASR